MSKERPIIMDSDSVRAILDNRKSQTRRLVKPQPESIKVIADGKRLSINKDGFLKYEKPLDTPYGIPGDRLWVRETWAFPRFQDDLTPSGVNYTQAIFYKPDVIRRLSGPGTDGPWWMPPDRGKWRSPIHMPRWVSRLTLEIKNVRVERVQEISEDDARREGVDAWFPKSPELLRYVQEGGSYRNGFHEQWDDLNAKRGYPWSSNPWVFVIEFRRIEP